MGRFKGHQYLDKCTSEGYRGRRYITRMDCMGDEEWREELCLPLFNMYLSLTDCIQNEGRLYIVTPVDIILAEVWM